MTTTEWGGGRVVVVSDHSPVNRRYMFPGSAGGLTLTPQATSLAHAIQIVEEQIIGRTILFPAESGQTIGVATPDDYVVVSSKRSLYGWAVYVNAQVGSDQPLSCSVTYPGSVDLGQHVAGDLPSTPVLVSGSVMCSGDTTVTVEATDLLNGGDLLNFGTGLTGWLRVGAQTSNTSSFSIKKEQSTDPLLTVAMTNAGNGAAPGKYTAFVMVKLTYN
ncbi:hypothetical protein [Serratia nematodiphila]|uniref:hypothetical protein n=1 Tax=Serratia nematodiphila TaxID=458197 RepID=UPI0011D5B01C|nr:hypothetical protein [Serratia nematodiphila]TXE66624.1 hypothetical protein FOT58_02340 [Serratia nematodiphila]